MTHGNGGAVALSVIVPTFNEGRHVTRLLDSLAEQDLDLLYEVLVVDGRSTDDTRQKVDTWVAANAQRLAGSPSVRLLDNEKRRTPFAFNIGLREAAGVHVAILGAHARYERNYLSACLNEVRSAPAPTMCGGLVRTVAANDSLAARLVVSVLLNPFASSGSSFRTVTAGPVDTIAFPVVARDVLLDAGGYDERLTRNQDNDMNERLRGRGIKLQVTDKTGVDYTAVASPALLLRYAWRNGWWSATSALIAKSRMPVRYFVPAAFVGSVGTAASVAVLGRATIARVARLSVFAALGAHVALAVRAGRRERGVVHGTEHVFVPPLILGFHMAYGMGTIASFASAAGKRFRGRS